MLKSRCVETNFIIWKSENRKWAISVSNETNSSLWKLRVSSYDHAEYAHWTTSGAVYDFPERIPRYVKDKVNEFFLRLGKYGEVRDLKMFAFDRVQLWEEGTGVYRGYSDRGC